VIDYLNREYQLVAKMLYGSGLPVSECLRRRFGGEDDRIFGMSLVPQVHDLIGGSASSETVAGDVCSAGVS
jgi:hypothetical protein